MPDHKCDAFEHIPAAIWNGDVDHTEPFNGDKGILFDEDTSILGDFK